MSKTIAWVFTIVGILGFLLGAFLLWLSLSGQGGESSFVGFILGVIIIPFSLISFSVGANKLKRLNQASLLQNNAMTAEGLNVYQVITRVIVTILIFVALWILVSWLVSSIHYSQIQPVRVGP